MAYGIHTYLMSMFYRIPYVLHAMQCNCVLKNVGLVLLTYAMLHFVGLHPDGVMFGV